VHWSARRPTLRQRASRRLSLVVLIAAVLHAGLLPAEEREPPPVVTSFQISGGAESISSSAPVVQLHHTVAGMRPTQYRVGHHADFSDATWQTYVDVPAMRNWFSGTRGACGGVRDSHIVVLFFQVRADLGVQVRVVDGQRSVVPQTVESNVVRDSICAVAGG
jgi:hypothetical protein